MALLQEDSAQNERERMTRSILISCPEICQGIYGSLVQLVKQVTIELWELCSVISWQNTFDHPSFALCLRESEGNLKSIHLTCLAPALPS